MTAKPVLGLIGTISKDEIVRETGEKFHQLGGILYQAATLCGLGEETALFANLAQGLALETRALISEWSSLRTKGIIDVAGPGNLVHLYYPEQGERREILESVVPGLDPRPVIRALPGLSFLVMVVNSGFELTLEAWREIVASAACPVWFDVHSLSLEQVLGAPRGYRPLSEWGKWVLGTTYLQANRKEVACMLGHPERLPLPSEIERFCREALDLGPEAVFVTLGPEGGLAVTLEGSRRVGLKASGRVVDTTGCGDVFGAGTAARLAYGADPFTAAAFGIDLASRAAFTAGIAETYKLAAAGR